MHGTFYYDGNTLMYRDTSTNGTLINNVNIHKRSVPVHHGDIIMIAGQYPLNWNQIDSFFPQRPVRNMGTMVSTPQQEVAAAGAPNLSKWNWGAFFLTGIWGIGNGCWWLFLIYFFLIIMCLIPIINIFGGMMSLALSIICGMKGTEWAWVNKQWSSVSEFESTQSTWAKVGLGLFLFGIATTIFSALFIVGQLM